MRLNHNSTVAEGNVAVLDMTAVSLGEFFNMDFPARDFILSPWLLSESINMIHAWRGTGKTLFAMQLAIAAATGEKFGPWYAPHPRKVLYIDGEMPVDEVRERFRQLASDTTNELLLSNLRILSAGIKRQGLPDISISSNHIYYKEEAEKADLIIVDNLSCLAQGNGKENDAESWTAVQNWAIALRALGKTIIFLHHSGKGGEQRGTSKREDVAEVVIALKAVRERQVSRQGAEFEVRFEKIRGLGQGIVPIVLKLETDSNGKSRWEHRLTTKFSKEQVLQMKEEGLTQTAIADIFKVDKSTISRAVKK